MASAGAGMPWPGLWNELAVVHARGGPVAPYTGRVFEDKAPSLHAAAGSGAVRDGRRRRGRIPIRTLQSHLHRQT